IRSANVDLPWSMWATMQKFLIREGSVNVVSAKLAGTALLGWGCRRTAPIVPCVRERERRRSRARSRERRYSPEMARNWNAIGKRLRTIANAQGPRSPQQQAPRLRQRQVAGLPQRKAAPVTGRPAASMPVPTAERARQIV